MAAVVKCLVIVYLLFNVCYCNSPVTELPETVMHLLNVHSKFYPHADHSEVAVGNFFCTSFSYSLDSGAQPNGERIRPLESLVRQKQYYYLE